MDQKAPLWTVWAQEFDSWPINGFNGHLGHPYDKGRAHKRPVLRRMSVMGISALGRVSARLTLARSPRMGCQDPDRTIRLNHQVSWPHPLRVLPRQEGIAIPKTRHGRQEKARALRVLPFEKTSKGVFYSSAGSGATPTGCARAHPLES